ncbi:MAG: hypothetical protein R2697_16985 [Ilumatobacteraceae bacterium]
MSRRLTAILIVALAVSGLASRNGDVAEAVAGNGAVKAVRCLAEARIDLLNGLFDSEPAGVVGADYQRATALPDGRVLWTFQDAAVRTGPDEIDIVHNIAAVQDGACFSILYNGTRSEPRPYFYDAETDPYARWFWPLDAAPGTDGRVYVFVAEMEEQGEEYLEHAVPVATRVVSLDGTTLAPVGKSYAPNRSTALYGWSVTSDASWTYLYAQCHRQFGFDLVNDIPAHDACARRVTVGRVPRGQVMDTPTYWDGARWQSDPARAVSIVDPTGRIAHATQIEWTGASFVAVDKLDDWWGRTITFGRSTSPTGPFVQFAAVPEPLKCSRLECNTFFATWVPTAAASRPENTLGWMISHNRWDGRVTAIYRPSFHTIPLSRFLPAGVVYPVEVPDDDGVPVLNVTAVAPAGPGHVTVFPCDRQVPTASNLNYAAGETVANLVMVRPDANGRVCFVSHADTDLVVDTSGGTAGGFVPLDAPTRIRDTRTGVGGPIGRLLPGQAVEVQLPAGVGPPVLNVTAVAPSGAGHVTAFPCDRDVPTASNLNYAAGETVANLVMVRPDADGRVCFVSHAAIDLVVDLAGRWNDTFAPLDQPERVVDTRRL